MQERERDPHSKTIVNTKTHDTTPDSSDYHNHHRPCIMVRAAFRAKKGQTPPRAGFCAKVYSPCSTPGGQQRRSARPLPTRAAPGGEPGPWEGRLLEARIFCQGAHSPCSSRGRGSLVGQPPGRGRADWSRLHIIKSCNTGLASMDRSTLATLITYNTRASKSRRLMISSPW